MLLKQKTNMYHKTAVSLRVVLTQSGVHFSSALLDFVFGGAAAVADASAHLLISVGLRTVGQAVTGLPAVKAQLEERRRQGDRSEEGNKDRDDRRKQKVGEKRK